ncbi:hypothetical protein [Undibacter mobilis]|uniref:Uncharacterized protein n=1 Tax=Undibacter mobilis TaxID=2292256 RepID=A0A371BDD9_9BRAD|nr:hypothetical protein [Undibacter mobilis]RDV05609.1 hypothetical protein DXH78_14130 [Undibacter mobilis]
MIFTFSRTALLALLLMTGTGAAYGDDLADFNAAVERAASHNRVADGYLRTGNTDLASLELDRLRESWAALTQRFGGKRPEPFKDGTLYTTTLLKISTGLVAADMMLQTGRMDAARAALDGMRRDLYDLRKSAGIVVLADCIRDANAIADAIMVYNDRNLNWDNSDTARGLSARSAEYLKTLDRCNSIAAPDVRNSPEFRRLVDGARAGLGLIPKAIETRDSNLVHRVLIELRSFDNLLAFRFG